MKLFREIQRRMLWKGEWLSLIFFVVIGCSQITPTSPIFFPQMWSTTYMDAGIMGQLIVEENCLRLKNTEGNTSYLLIWPTGFRVREKDNLIQIFDETDEFVAKEGDEVTLFGGEVPEKFRSDLEQQMGQEFPEECLGPYWIVAPSE